MRANLAGYILVAALSVIGLAMANSAQHKANVAQKFARHVDHRGDIRACQQENLIRRVSNDRDAKLERTAELTVAQIAVLRHTRGDGTRAELNDLARKAREIQTSFTPGRIVDCAKVFPEP